MSQSGHSKHQISRARSPISRKVAWLVSATIACAAGCGGNVMVGEAKDDGGAPASVPTSTSDGGAVNQTPPPADCAAADSQSRAAHDAWLVQSNAFGSLTGRTFTGYLDGGSDVTLSIDADGSATFAVGQPAPAPAATSSYLCGNGIQDGSQCQLRYSHPPLEGAVYALHGATFTADRLLVPIQLNGPYDAWCALQTPHENDACFFQPIGLDGFSITPSTGMCALAGAPVDCGWMELAQLGVCGCTSSACFAAIDPSPPARIDARFDETTHELSGTFVDADRPRVALHLTEAAP
jgi:hypothetical protein